jgi:hypothetical protein
MDIKCLFFFKDNRRCAFAFCKIRRPEIAGKTGPRFFGLKIHFQFIFDPKHLENTLNILISLSVASKNIKPQKTEVNPNLKTFPRSNLSPREMRKKKTPK